MLHEAELQFLQKSLNRCHIQTLFLDKSTPPTVCFDFGLRQLLGITEPLSRLFGDLLFSAQPCTIYKLTDSFLCSYLYLRLPDEQPLFLLVGPYLETEPTHQQLLEQAERIGIPPQNIRRLETYYSGIPLLQEDHAALVMLNVFCETVWGNDTFSVVEIDHRRSEPLSIPTRGGAESTLHNMQILETRYAYENELIQAVTQGLTHKAELLFGGFPERAIEARLPDRVRNLKNYGVIMNTLLRKAAEAGGVHPIYLDETSNDFARRIEQAPTAQSLRELMGTMARSYCRLVKRHAIKHYSPLIQRVIVCIDTDLAGDLSLNTLATMQNINPSYLSALFRRETGQTLTEHVNEKRIRLAVQLLRSTRLQVQTIAQHCGIPDVNYFSKLFKKHTGKTPRAYRQTTSGS